jgi:hypothetical protein
MQKLIVALAVLWLISPAAAQTSGGNQTATVTLSVAQLQSLRDTPVVLIPAQGVGTAISPVSATLQYNFGTHNYAGGHGRFIITLGPYASDNPISAFDDLLTAGFVDQDSNQTVTLQADAIDPSVSVENLDLEIVNFGPPLIDGDGTVTVTVSYNVVSTQ